MLALLALSVVVLAVAVVLFLRAGAAERRPELRLTREQELVRLAEEHRRLRAGLPADPPARDEGREPDGRP